MIVILVLTVDVFSMTHDYYINKMPVIVNFIYDSIIANSDAPETCRTLKFLASGWSWILCERFYPGKYAPQ
jgi:hypothetical protein